MATQKSPTTRAVVSLHLPRPMHATIAKAAKKQGKHVSAFIREAAALRAVEVLAEAA